MSKHKTNKNNEVKKILIIDDSNEVRNSIKEALNGKNLLLKEAIDGESGQKLILENQDANLFIIDYHMPGYNGLELTKLIREHPKMKETPVIIYTTETSSEMRSKARKFKKVLWLLKPMHADSFTETVMNIVNGERKVRNQKFAA
ncbi:MAG: response regulator [Oligoflexia bacterium]|nr:response regulator [Oligoflexia bacterium]